MIAQFQGREADSELKLEDNVIVRYLTPLLLGLAPFIFAIIALEKVQYDLEREHATVFWIVVTAGIFVFIAVMDWNTSKMADIKGRIFKRAKPFLTIDSQGRNFSLFFGLISVLMSLTSFLLLYNHPLTLPQRLGPAGIAFLAFALVIPILSLLVIISRKFRAPLYLIFIALLLVNSLSIFGGNKTHAVRTLDPDKNSVLTDLGKRHSIRDEFERYLNYRIASDETFKPCNDDQDKLCIPVAFVSAAGGASRASYWTQSTLWALEANDEGRFHENIFTITAVSGAAVAAVSYNGIHRQDTALTQDKYLQISAAFNGEDYLAPALSGMLFIDPVHDLIPFSGYFPAVLGSNDRSASLEIAMEQAWRRNFEAQTDRTSVVDLSESFQNLYYPPGEKWIPGLVLVGSHQESGKRILTSHFLVPENVDILDFFDLSGRDIASSTAIMNSARFPIVSPPGLIRDSDDNPLGHIIDGGYFENNGIETTIDIYLEVVEAFKAMSKNDSFKAYKIEPIFIEINNDDGLDCLDLLRSGKFDHICDPTNGSEEVPTRKPARRNFIALNEITGPLQGLLSARGGRGIMGTKRLSESAFQNHASQEFVGDQHYINFALCPQSQAVPEQETVKNAMSWSLSLPSRADLDLIFHKKPFALPSYLSPRQKELLLKPRDETDCVKNNRAALQYVICVVNQETPCEKPN